VLTVQEKVLTFYGRPVNRIEGDEKDSAVMWTGDDAKEMFYSCDHVLVCASYTQRFFDED
jgi:hypothetical protein